MVDNNLTKLKKFVADKDMSLLHKEVLRKIPINDQGIFYLVPPFIPVSYYGKKKPDVAKKLKEYFRKEAKRLADKVSKIWDKELEIIIIYNLGSKYSNTDVDNLNKMMVDCMKGSLFKDDKQIKLIVGRKDNIDKKELRGKYIEKAIIRIDLFENSEINKLLEKKFNNSSIDLIPEDN